MKTSMIFSREELYREIWEISAKQVSLKYDLSYTDLLKKCKEHDIPLPRGNYWYKKNTGQDLTELIVPLPHADIDTVQVEKNYLKIKKAKSKIQEVEKSSLKNDSINKIDIENLKQSLSFLDENKVKRICDIVLNYEISDNKRLHKTVANLRDKIIEWNKREKAASYSYLDARYRRNDLREPKFIKNISTNALPRLYRFLDSLVTIIEQIGDKVTSDFEIKVGQDTVRFEVIESTDKIAHELTKEEAKSLAEYNDSMKFKGYGYKPRIRKYDYLPNGKFRFKILDGKLIKDTQQVTIEQLFPEIIISIYQEYGNIKNKRFKREEEQRLYAEEQERKRQLQDRIELEKKRTQELLNMLDDFQTANHLRLMAEQLQLTGKYNADEIDWMKSKADWIDPLVSAEDELLGTRNHRESKEQKERFLNEKKYYW